MNRRDALKAIGAMVAGAAVPKIAKSEDAPIDTTELENCTLEDELADLAVQRLALLEENERLQQDLECAHEANVRNFYTARMWEDKAHIFFADSEYWQEQYGQVKAQLAYFTQTPYETGKSLLDEYVAGVKRSTDWELGQVFKIENGQRFWRDHYYGSKWHTEQEWREYLLKMDQATARQTANA
jgi:hypothetical protein